ncbi:MAG: class I SAM-dependent methyltransferase [Anaerolineales bacterium]
MRLPSIRGRLGFFLYLQGRNDRVWESLRPEDKKLVLQANQLHNNFRPDYADPELYQGGQDFDSLDDRGSTIVGTKLLQFLQRRQPASVIEIGPGSGFYTHSIAHFPSVTKLTLIDIVDAFLGFLNERLAKLSHTRKGFSHAVLHGDFQQMKLDPVDAIVLLSTVHHIPNRLDLFQWIHSTLKPGGSCFISEPAHYWPRRNSLFGKFMREYHTPAHRARIENYSTHHFCTLEEFEKITSQIPGLQIHSYLLYRMDFPRFTRKVVNRLLKMAGYPRDTQGSVYLENRKSPVRFFSQRMIVEFTRVQ